MRDKKRIKPFLKKLEKYWEDNSQLRFGQVIYILAKELNVDDIFFPEEDKWGEVLDRLNAKIEKQ
jgi:hypothetical protein